MSEMTELVRAVGRIEGKLDAVITRQDGQEDEAACLEKRVRSLEGWRWYLLGAAGAVGVVASIAFKFL